MDTVSYDELIGTIEGYRKSLIHRDLAPEVIKGMEFACHDILQIVSNIKFEKE